MKNEEIPKNTNLNKKILNSLKSYNSYTSSDFTKINSSNNIINTSGSQPIVIFKKISKSLTQTFLNHKSNQPTKNNYISDGGLRKKISKYKSFLSNPNQDNPTSANISKNNKIVKGPKTTRNINKKILPIKKEKLSKSNPKIYINTNNNRKNQLKKKSNEKIKNKDIIKTDYHHKESHSQGHFNRKNKIFQKHFVNKSINDINYNTSNNYHKKDDNNKKTKNNNIKNKTNNKIKINKNNINNNNNKIKIKIDNKNKNKEIEESKLIEESQKKREYINELIKNGVLNVTKELNIIKKLTPKEILNKKKKDFLQENGITEININKNEKRIKIQPEINIKSIRKKNISTKNSNCLKNKSNNKLNISKSNSRYFSFINNNTNTNINMTNTNLLTNNKETQESNNNFKKINLKPQINQFEYINKIQKEQKKLPGYKKQNASRGLEKYLRINDYEPKLSDSFRHTSINPKMNINIDKNINNEINIKRNSVENNYIKKEKREKLIEEADDEFPYSHKKSYRSTQEIYKYLKEKRIETKKEEENTEKEKQLKAYLTFQNLMNIEKKLENNITKISPQFIPLKNRKEKKGHMKLRKEPNEYYVGTESSKNNSTFIDKKEYYISILESQKFVNKSKIEKQECDIDKDKDKDKIKEKKIENNKKIKSKIIKKKLTRGLSTGLFENKKIIDELYITINKANEIFSKENLNKFKNNLLKINTEINNTKKNEIDKLLTSKENENITKENNIEKNKNNININKKIIKSPELIIDIPNTTDSSNNRYNNKTININKLKNEIKTNNSKNNITNCSISLNNISGVNSLEKYFSHTYSNSLNPNKKIEKKIDQKIILNSINKIKIVIKRNIFTFLYKLYMDKYKIKTYTLAFNYLVIICKIYSFKKIEKYTRIQEYFEAFRELFKPFIHNKFKLFVKKCLEIKIRKFIFILELFFKYKAMNRLFIYCERDFKKQIIEFLVMTIKKPFNEYFFRKLATYKFEKNNKINNNNNKNDINLPLNIPLLNELIIENNNAFEGNKENYSVNHKGNFFIDDLLFNEVNNIFTSNSDYYSLSHQSKNIHSIKHIKNNEKMEINTHIKIKDLLNSENKENLKKLAKIKNPEEFSDKITNLIIEKIINTEIKPFSPLEKMIPYKSFKYDFLPKSQNTSLNNSYISSSCASLEISNNNSFNDPRTQALNESLISQMSYNSEFNKTIKDKKREQSLSFYVKKIAPKLIKLICDEIKVNYNRIYENISTPLRTDFKEIILALELKNNEQLKKNYRYLEVKEELKDIIVRENIIKKFLITNKKLRKKYNQDNINENFDIYLNLNIIDTAIEIINKQRFYGEIGEPFSLYSLRNREIAFKYNKNDPKKLFDLVYKSLMEYINNPIFLIKDSVINANEKKIINCFKKDLQENECQWKDIEIVETQSKLEVTELILDQLNNEIIEILEHVQLSRKKPDLYQDKSIYACEDIPKLSFQLTTTENELIQESEGRDMKGF